MQQFHKPADEKRMVVILPPECYQSWLDAQPENAMAFMQPLAAELLTAMSATPVTSSEAK